MAAKPKKLAEVLRRFDDDTGALDEHDVHQAISKKLTDDRESGQSISSEDEAEWAAFMFCPEYDWKDGGWRSYYGPMWGCKSEDGKDSYTPDIHEFDATTFDYWAKRAREARHPVLKMRYADLCWEFQKRFGGAAPNVELAHIVIDATIHAAARKLVKHEVNGKKKLARALVIALAIHDKSRVAKVRDAIVDYEDTVARDEFAGLWGFSYDLIVDDKKIPKSPALVSKIIGDLEARLMRLCAVRDGKAFDPWGAKNAALRLAKYYRRQTKKDDVRRVLLAYARTFDCLAEGASAIQATGWMRAVYEHYREFELREEAEAMLIKVREHARRSRDKKVAHRQEINIPRQEMDEFLNHITEGTLSDSLNRIAIEFLADKQQVVDLLRKQHASSPLMSMMSMSIVDGEGRPTAHIGGIDDDLEGRVAHQISQNMRFAASFLSLAIDRVHEKFSPSVEEILNHLQQSPVFPEDGFAILRPGLSCYFNNEHLTAAHVLVPQIEATVRHLLHLCGGNLWKPHRSGGLMLKNLEEVLREDCIAKSLSEGVVLNLRVLLTDQRGWNIRNGICHGLLTPGSFGRGLTDRLFHALLVLRHSVILG
jgi:hypothetical protein